MIKWEVFKYNRCEYDLSHLHPTTVVYEQPAKGVQIAKIFTVEVCYSLHCFTEGSSKIANVNPLRYSDTRETRLFDFQRYELSKQLPNIIEGLNHRSCMHTGHGNFFIVELTLQNGVKQEYEVYFEIKIAKPNIAHLFVNSAFAPDGRRTRKQTKKISLFTILANRLSGKPIKAPR
jgi:hypothetical protein